MQTGTCFTSIAIFCHNTLKVAHVFERRKLTLLLNPDPDKYGAVLTTQLDELRDLVIPESSEVRVHGILPCVYDDFIGTRKTCGVVVVLLIDP